MKTYLLLALALLGTQLGFAQNNRSKAEVFIQVEDQGSFTVYLDDEFIGSPNGRFRFYEVYNTRPTLSILQGNRRVYSNKIDVNLDERLVLNYSARKGLQVSKTLKIYKDRKYALNDFDDYSDNYNTGIVPPRPIGPERIKAFNDLNALVKKEAFDDDKIKLIQAYVTYSDLSTAQTATLLKHFSQDDKKLSLAKNLVPAINDIQHYYTLKDAFTFRSNQEEFIRFLNSSTTPRAEQPQRTSPFEQLKAMLKKEAFDDNKTKLIQAAVKNSAPSTAQMEELLKLYTFENKALECAKWAYPYISDQQNYFTLKDFFRSKSNQKAFIDYINRK